MLHKRTFLMLTMHKLDPHKMRILLPVSAIRLQVVVWILRFPKFLTPVTVYPIGLSWAWKVPPISTCGKSSRNGSLSAKFSIKIRRTPETPEVLSAGHLIVGFPILRINPHESCISLLFHWHYTLVLSSHFEKNRHMADTVNDT